MSGPSVPDCRASEPHRSIGRLLFVADAAVADVDELPPHVRAVIDEAAEIFVITPSLPGRLAWLADDVDRFRHVADERLDTVLGHLRSINAFASGDARRGSLLTVFADGVEAFKPDHVLLALRSPEHANWQEHGLIEHVEQRFGLPVTSYAVDPQGFASSANGPMLLCYDGSADARNAIERAGALFAGRRAVVATAWQPTLRTDGMAWSDISASTVDFIGLDSTAAGDARRLADVGAQLARKAGLRAESMTVEAPGAVWKAIVDTADRLDATAIVTGSRGLTGLRSMLLGSVSNGVVHHAGRPTLVVRRAGADTDDQARRQQQPV